jgi:hypothetical protein
MAKKMTFVQRKDEAVREEKVVVPLTRRKLCGKETQNAHAMAFLIVKG